MEEEIRIPVTFEDEKKTEIEEKVRALDMFLSDVTFSGTDDQKLADAIKMTCDSIATKVTKVGKFRLEYFENEYAELSTLRQAIRGAREKYPEITELIDIIDKKIEGLKFSLDTKLGSLADPRTVAHSAVSSLSSFFQALSAMVAMLKK